MRIDGQWSQCDDGIIRPVVLGRVRSSSGGWEAVRFLVDTGADRTVLCATTLDLLDLSPVSEDEQLGGIAGITDSVIVQTQIRLPVLDGSPVVFRGEYAGLTELQALDMSVLGRDVMDMFAVIIDRPDGVVCLVGQRHRYVIHTV